MKLTIGEWKAEPATNELRRGRETVRLEPKAMDLLMLLARRAGDVVSREELFEQVWPGTVVGDEALTQSIAKLRRALGDDPKSPSYIETISKRGYRLLAPVSRAEALPGRLPWIAGAFFVLAAAAAYVLNSPPRTAVEPAAGQGAEREGGAVSVTVLPFESLGAAGESAYLARGISDNLAIELGGLSGLRLFKSGGRYVVSGTVQREASTLRINVHLVDTRTHEQVWSQRFERPFGDLLAVQDEIARRLAESLPARLSDAERRRLAKRHTQSVEAYDQLLRAQALFLARGRDENLQARDLYRKALELDPKFARAYAGLAMTHAMEQRLGGARDGSGGLERALELAETARQIDPEIAEVHWAIGFVQVQARRHGQAIESLQRAIELNPSFADAYALLGGIHTYTGEPARSIPLLRTALRLNPGGGHLYFLLLGRAYLFEGDVEQALINLREAQVRNPMDLETRIYLAAALMAHGDRSAAEWEAQEIRALERGFSLQGWLESYPLTSQRHREKLRELLAAASL